MNLHENENKLISRSAAAKTFGVTPQTISNYIKRGLLKTVKNGRWTMITKSSLDQMVSSMRSDDETKTIFEKTSSANNSAKQIYQKSIENNSLLYMLCNTHLSELLCTIVKSMGKNHLTAKEIAIMCDYINNIDRKHLSQIYNMTTVNIQTIYNKTLSKLKELPTYSDLEYKISVLNQEKEIMADEMEKMRNQIKELRNGILKNRMSAEQASDSDINTDVLKILYTKIENVPFNVRCFNVMRSVGIKYLIDIVEYPKLDLLKIPNMGRKSLSEIEDILDSYGLHFGMNVEKYKEMASDMLCSGKSFEEAE